MGFDASAASKALRAHDRDVNRAALSLISIEGS